MKDTKYAEVYFSSFFLQGKKETFVLISSHLETEKDDSDVRNTLTVLLSKFSIRCGGRK